MNKPRFASALGPDLERYLTFKKSMGIYCDGRIWYLRSFDRYCAERSLKNLDRSTVEGWVSSRLSSHPNGRRSWMSYIRDFGRWERLKGNEDAYVLSDEWRADLVRPQPYLLTNKENTQVLRCRDTGGDQVTVEVAGIRVLHTHAFLRAAHLRGTRIGTG